MNLKSTVISILLFALFATACQVETETVKPTLSVGLEYPASETSLASPLPELHKITLENAKDVQLMATFQIPNYTTSYTRGQCSTCFSPDGELVAGVCIKNRIPLWDVKTGVLVREHAGSLKNEIACTFDPLGETLVTGGFGPSISFWDVASGERNILLGEYDDPVWDIDFSPDGQMLAAVTLDWDGLLSNPPDDENIRDIQMWDVESGEQFWSAKQGRNFSLSVDFHPGGEVIAVGKTRGDIYIHDAATGEELFAFNTVPGWPNAGAGNIGDLAYSPSGKYLAAGSDDKKIWLWEAENYELVGTLEGHDSYINGVIFNPDETFLVSSSDDATIGIWDLDTREMIKRLEGHAETALRVDLNLECTLIASISWDGTVKLWGIPVSE